MYVHITFPPRSAHPIDAMLDCHERVRRFLGGARRLAALSDPLDPLAPGGAAVCARYFREGLPLHARDEDLSLTPRLRPVAPPEVREALDRIAAEHDQIHAAIDAILPALDDIARGGPIPGELAARIEALAGILEPHLAVEEEVIYPAARAALSVDDVPKIRAEMAWRRR